MADTIGDRMLSETGAFTRREGAPGRRDARRG